MARHIREGERRMGRTLRTLLVAECLALAAVGTSAAAQQQTPNANPPKATQPEARLSRIPVVAADSLAGRQLTDSSGSTGGTIKYALIAPVTGQVQALIVGSGGPLDVGVQYAVVPWRAVASVPPGDGPVRISAAFDQLRQGPKVSEETLTDLSRPELMTTVINSYARRGETSADQHGQSAAPSNNKSAASQPQVLVGRDVVTALVSPPTAPTSRMIGADVRTPSGKDVGEIEHVMIDTAHGQVAYVILGRGGFLGMDEDWVPMPVQSLSWAPASGSFIVNASEKAIDGLPALKHATLPSSVSVAQLGGLYQRFALSPYWQQTAEAHASEPTGQKSH